MSQGKEFVADIEEILHPLQVRSRAMFGAYGLYCDEKFVAIIMNDQLYIKRSEADPTLLEVTELTPPFDGAGEWHLVPEDMLREGGWMRDVIQETADALPVPKPRKKSPSRARRATEP